MSKMFNCSESTLLELTHDEVWYRMLKDRSHVRIPGTNPIKSPNYNYIKDQPDNEWEILDRDGVNIHENEVYVNDALTKPQMQLSHPSDVFFDNTRVTSSLKGNYGTLVLTKGSMNAKYLTRNWMSTITEGQTHSWESVLTKFHQGKTPPSNALIIIDRYLFAYNPQSRTDYKNGIRNVYGILKELLPVSFSGEYHVLLVFDDTAISNGATIDLIAKGLQKIKKKLGRSYFLTIEILTVNSNVDRKVFSQTHNRMIISNYYMISCDHGFSAICPPREHMTEIYYIDSGTGAWTQTIRYDGIYASIDADAEDFDMRSLPIRTCDYAITFLREYIHKLQNGNLTGYFYVLNGNMNVSINNFLNRLITTD